MQVHGLFTKQVHGYLEKGKKSSFTRRTYSWPYFSSEIKDLILFEQQMLR